MRCSLTGLLLGTCLSLAACAASDKPSDKQACRLIEESLQYVITLGGKVVDCRKHNAEVHDMMGEKLYDYQFLASVELPAGLIWHEFFAQSSVEKDPGLGHEPAGQVVRLPKGSIVVRRGEINFRSTEKGWVSYGVNMNTTQDAYCTALKPVDCYTKLGWDKLNP
jgi:hypothetical protein